MEGLNGDFARGGFRDDLDDVNNVISPIGMGIAPDFPDIVQLPPPYQSIGINSFAKHSGAHLMHVLRFEGDPEFTLSMTNETLEIGYGARFYAGLQDYRVYVSGGMMGEFKLDSSIASQALGPQVSIKWTVRNGPWQASAEAAAALTYMNIDGNQRGQIGEDLVPGRYNQGLYVSPSPVDNHLNKWDVSPALEAGLLASYDITPTTHCFIRGDAIQFGNVRDAEGAIIYSLPRMGLQDPGGHDITVTAASIGIEIRR